MWNIYAKRNLGVRWCRFRKKKYLPVYCFSRCATPTAVLLNLRYPTDFCQVKIKILFTSLDFFSRTWWGVNYHRLSNDYKKKGIILRLSPQNNPWRSDIYESCIEDGSTIMQFICKIINIMYLIANCKTYSHFFHRFIHS